jgi:hypothetical protein
VEFQTQGRGACFASPTTIQRHRRSRARSGRGANAAADAHSALALRDNEHWFALTTHYLFGAIPVGGNA